ncbi:MAG: iron-containing alcohol dehydrogenase family protein [Clostridiales bacterium]|nr:iron-containing alcohol dehydrogenase family protein [Clostridiales bacterium]
MNHYSIFLPSYTIGENPYERVGAICRPYGSTAVVIGGYRAMAAAGAALDGAAKEGEIRILDYLWFGGECSYENVERLQQESAVQQADMIFAVGGGKATDTAKALANIMEKPVFTFPTISSNCSACTSVSIMYHADGSFYRPFFFEKPPVHAFIHLGIIARSPEKYMWAGMGDTYAKYFESTVSSRGEELSHYIRLGVVVSSMCLEPILTYGAKALEDNRAGRISAELEQVVLAVVVSTGIASILLTQDQIIDYNTGLGHAVFYALTSFPHIEKGHLHGEVVSYGILILLLVDGQKEMFEKLYAFSRSVGLPTRLSDVEITEEQLGQVIEKTLEMKDIDHNPYKVTREMLEDAFRTLETRGKTQ